MHDDSEVLRTLGRIEGTISAIERDLRGISDRIDRTNSDIKQVNDKAELANKELSLRVNVLEKKQYAIFAVSGVIATCISIVSKFLPEY